MSANWEQIYQEKLCSAKEAAALVKDGDCVYIGTCSNVAYTLAEALADRSGELKDVTIASGLVSKPLRVFSDSNFLHSSYFMGGQERISLKLGTMDYHSIHLSQFDIWCQKVAKPNVLFLEVSIPDKDGNVNLSSNGTTLNSYLLEQAETIVLQVNPRACRVYGENALFPIEEATAIVVAEDEQAELPQIELNDTVKKLSQYVVDEIPDGATIQLGAGRVATAIGFGLKKKHNLGIHTEMMSDSLMELLLCGAATNLNKTLYPCKSIIGFAWGSLKLYQYLDQNKDCWFLPMTKVNDPYVIAQNEKMMSINSASAIDLTGQVSAETINGKQYSGIGGQLDYVRGAQMSKGGKSFIVMESTYGDIKNGKGGSRIVLNHTSGNVVTTPRSDVQYVATEYGCVNLKELSMHDRTRALIDLAHPQFREQLTFQTRAAGLL